MAIPQIQGMDTEYKPWGGLAGIMTGERQALQEAANLQGLEESQLSNVIKRIQAMREQSDFSRPGMEEARQLGDIGKYNKLQAEGTTALGTMQSGIDSTNAKNITATSGSKIDNMINLLDNSLAMIQANGAGAGMALVLPNLPPQLQEMIGQAGDKAPLFLQKFSEMLKQQRMRTPAHLGKLEEIDKKAENDYITHTDQAEITADASRYGADQRLKGDQLQASVAAQGHQATQERTREDQITRRINSMNNRVRENADQIKDLKEYLATIDTISLAHLPPTQRISTRENMKKNINTSIQTLENENSQYKAEMDSLSGLSKFSKDKKKTNEAPTGLPNGVTVKP